MELVRALLGGDVVLARVDGDDATVLAYESAHPAADVLREVLADGVALEGRGLRRVPLGGLHPLAPVRSPSKIIAVGLNYADHARESRMEIPSAPLLFAKTANAIIGPGEAITYRSGDSKEVDYEAELALIVGSRASAIEEEAALDAILGYTIANDVSARDAQFIDGQWMRGKSFDSFAPLGPRIVTSDAIDPAALAVRCHVNGRLLQDSSTSEMIFGPARLVSYISRFITLEPGDVILTGTPFGVGFSRQPPVFLVDGDVVDVEIEGLGTLTNSVAVLDR